MRKSQKCAADASNKTVIRDYTMIAVGMSAAIAATLVVITGTMVSV